MWVLGIKSAGKAEPLSGPPACLVLLSRCIPPPHLEGELWALCPWPFLSTVPPQSNLESLQLNLDPSVQMPKRLKVKVTFSIPPFYLVWEVVRPHYALSGEQMRTGSLQGCEDQPVCTPSTQCWGSGGITILHPATGRLEGRKQGSLTALSITQPGRATLYSLCLPQNSSQKQNSRPGCHVQPPCSDPLSGPHL